MHRARVALAGALALSFILGPVVADAASGPLACRGTTTVGPWQQVPVEAFGGVESVQTRDVVTAYAVDAARPARVLATNGNTIKASASDGCAWEDALVLTATPSAAVPFSGTTATIVSAALLPGGPALAAVREGSAAASRPHIVRSLSGAKGSWAASDSGLPAQGAPRQLEATSDGRTAYLVLSPTSSGGSAGGTLPALPGAPADTGPAGLLYATTDGGASWALRTGADSLRSGIDALTIDPKDPDLLYAVSGGRLVVSTDGGRSVTDTGLTGVTAIEAMEAGEVVAATADGVSQSTDAGASFTLRAALSGVDALAHRAGDDVVIAASQGQLFRVDARRASKPVLVPAGAEVTPGSAIGDRARDGSFHVLAGHVLLRWLDAAPPGGQAPLPVVGELAAPPPPPGRVEPPSRSISLPVGQSSLQDFTLVLPPSPTPLDVFFLVDTSPGMQRYIDALKDNFRAISTALERAGIDVKVGLGTAGAGPGDGEAPFPDADPTKQNYRKPAPYTLLRPVGDVNAQLQTAFDGLRADSNMQSNARLDIKEGQLIALNSLVTGEGVLEEGSSELAPRYTVQPGQRAGFRPQEGIRRLVVHATDENFNNPHGTPRKADGTPDVERIAGVLAAQRVQQIGIAPDEGSRATANLSTMARLTGALAPAEGVDCGNDLRVGAGQPLVCETVDGFGAAIIGLVRGLVDEQDVRLVAPDRSPVLGAIDATKLRGLDVTARNDVPFRVRASCVGLAPGRYTQSLDAVLRGFRVATAKLAVTCTAPLTADVTGGAVAAAAQQPGQPAQDPPAIAQPVAQAPVPPVAQPQGQPQPQGQVQTQVQTQPMTAAALQQQEQLQLALALLGEERPDTELAMVDRRDAERSRALALLATVLAVSAAVGLARLRSAPAVRRSR